MIRELSRRQLLVLLIGAILAVTTAGIGVYGLLRGPSAPSTDPSVSRPAGAPGAPGASAAPQGHEAPPRPDPSTAQTAGPRNEIPRTGDPVAYARAIATALFDWDTGSGYLPTDYTAPVLADADPSGEETPGLIGDVATYLPTTDQWLNLATMHVAQTITIDTAAVPADWPTILGGAHGQLRPGTTAVTITGIRHRTGTWEGQPAATTSPVSFTVFVACAPAFDRCHLLRLSQLDNPLR